MLTTITLGTLAAVVVGWICKLASMRSIDLLSLACTFLEKSGIHSLLVKAGMYERYRPKPVDVTAPNGFKTKFPSIGFTWALKNVINFETRDDDVFVASYPKSGTTWTQEIVWLICNNADIERAKAETLSHRSPFMETIDFGDLCKGIQTLENSPTTAPRVIKTHLQWELLPTQLTSKRRGKIICVARNPKDTCVSYYHFHKMNVMLPKSGTWEEFLANFTSGDIGCGSWFEHTLKYWEEFKKDGSLVYFTTYEKLKIDFRTEVANIAKFLEKTLTNEQLDVITSHCSFNSMSKNKSTNYSHGAGVGFNFKTSSFMRKGQVGDWKNHFTLNQSQAFDEVYKEKMGESDLDFCFEL